MFNKRYARGGPRKSGDPLPDWLLAIHAVNAIDKIFGNPLSVGQREGVGYVEEYVDADVIFPDDDPLTVAIVAKSDRGDQLLRQVSDS